jgi:hypothetical protein
MGVSMGYRERICLGSVAVHFDRAAVTWWHMGTGGDCEIETREIVLSDGPQPSLDEIVSDLVGMRVTCEDIGAPFGRTDDWRAIFTIHYA